MRLAQRGWRPAWAAAPPHPLTAESARCRHARWTAASSRPPAIPAATRMSVSASRTRRSAAAASSASTASSGCTCRHCASSRLHVAVARPAQPRGMPQRGNHIQRLPPDGARAAENGNRCVMVFLCILELCPAQPSRGSQSSSSSIRPARRRARCRSGRARRRGPGRSLPIVLDALFPLEAGEEQVASTTLHGRAAQSQHQTGEPADLAAQREPHDRAENHHPGHCAREAANQYPRRSSWG